MIKRQQIKKDFSRPPLSIFFSYIAPHWRPFAVDMLCAVAVAAVDLAFPIISRQSMRTLLPKGKYGVFFLVIGILLAAYVLKGFLYYVITVVGHGMGVRVEADMRRDLFTHIQSLSFSFFDHNRTGVLMSRVTNDLFDITELAHHGPENVLICALTILGSLAVMAAIRWELALVLVVLLPLSLWFTMKQRTRMRDANVEVKRKTAEINAAIESGISGVRTAKAFANEEAETEKFDRANELFKTAKREYYKSMGLFTSGMEFSMGAMQVVVIGAGGVLIMLGRMDYIDLITFTLYVSTFISPIRRLVQFMEQYMQGSAGFTRFLEIMRTEPEIQDAPGAAEMERASGSVEYRDVGFAYANGEPVLRHVDLNISPGERFALVGPSGGGKTTLCHLLPRFYDVGEGAVLVDGKDVRGLTQESLHRNIGIIQQDVFLTSATAGPTPPTRRWWRPPCGRRSTGRSWRCPRATTAISASGA